MGNKFFVPASAQNLACPAIALRYSKRSRFFLGFFKRNRIALNQGRAVIFRCADSLAIPRRSHEQSGRRKPTVRSGIYEKTQHHVECSAGTRCVTERTLLRQRRGFAIEQKKSQARINLTLKRAPETHTSGSQSLVSIPSVKEFLNLTLSALTTRMNSYLGDC